MQIPDHIKEAFNIFRHHLTANPNKSLNVYEPGEADEKGQPYQGWLAYSGQIEPWKMKDAKKRKEKERATWA